MSKQTVRTVRTRRRDSHLLSAASPAVKNAVVQAALDTQTAFNDLFYHKNGLQRLAPRYDLNPPVTEDEREEYEELQEQQDPAPAPAPAPAPVPAPADNTSPVEQVVKTGFSLAKIGSWFINPALPIGLAAGGAAVWGLMQLVNGDDNTDPATDPTHQEQPCAEEVETDAEFLQFLDSLNTSPQEASLGPTGGINPFAQPFTRTQE